MSKRRAVQPAPLQPCLDDRARSSAWRRWISSPNRCVPSAAGTPNSGAEHPVPLGGAAGEHPAEGASRRRGERVVEPLLALAQRLPRATQLLLGALARQQDAVRVLQRDRAQERFFLVVGVAIASTPPRALRPPGACPRRARGSSRRPCRGSSTCRRRTARSRSRRSCRAGRAECSSAASRTRSRTSSGGLDARVDRRDHADEDPLVGLQVVGG